MIISYPLPADARPLVEKDEKIDFNTPLYQIDSHQETKIYLAQELQINPKKIFNFLKKFVGEKIEKDEVLAVKKTFFSEKIIKSPVSGIIKEIDHHQGLVVIDFLDYHSQKIFSPFKGVVEKISKNEFQIKLNKPQEYQIKKIKTDFGGEVFYFKENQFFEINSDQVENKIIISEKISSFSQAKLEALGVKGFVTLESLPDKTTLNSVLIKNIADFEKIKKNQFPYCTVISKHDKIYFYQ